MTTPDLPTIVEVKRTLAGVEKRFECRVLARTPTHLAVLWIAPGAMHVHGVDLPAGTVSVGHFWTDRPYNVYHWLERGRTLAYYFNVGLVDEISEAQVAWRDLIIDVLVKPDGAIDILDEDDVPPDLPAEHRRTIAQALEQIVTNPKRLVKEIERESRDLL